MDFYKLAKELPGIIKDWRGVLLLIAGMVGTGVQTWNVTATEEQGNKKVREVAIAFQEHYEPKATATPKKAVVKSECGECLKLISDTNKRIDEWHGR